MSTTGVYDRGAWPWEPLERLLTARLGEPRHIGVPGVVRGQEWSGATPGNIARCIGTSARQVHRWMASGSLTTLQADRAAVALGLHPALAWDSWYADEPQEVGAS